MLDVLTGLVGGAVAPLVERLSAASANLLRKVALLLVAGLCLVVVLIALTIAFGLWVASLAGGVVGCLSVAGLYLLAGGLAVALALGGGAKGRPAPAGEPERREEERAFDAQVDQFSAPLLRMLQQLGLKRELLAVLAGTTVAKRLGPLPLVGLAIVGGFLVGRMWRSWRGLLTSDALAALAAALGFFEAGGEGPAAPDDGPA